ncbi:2-keto-3-deoxygluconate permease [Desemzia sp. FAM 23990]
MKKVPAGTFLIPMLVSAFIYTFWPNLFNIGGITQDFLGGSSINFIIGMITFCSGVGIDIKSVSKLLKHHGVVLLVKIILTIAAGLLYMNFFGQEGIFGISALAFVVALSSINPALYLSLVSDYGDEVDRGAFGVVSLFAIPALPLLVYAVSGGGTVSWMPIISTLIPLLLGIILGNLDHDSRVFFGSGTSILIPFLGWKTGQGMNLIDAFQAGLSGILLVVVFYILMSLLVIADKTLAKSDGVSAMSMNAVAGVSAAFPVVIAAANPGLDAYVSDASAQVLTASIVMVIVTPVITKKIYQKVHLKKNLSFFRAV